jgi:hypothetical protein
MTKGEGAKWELVLTIEAVPMERVVISDATLADGAAAGVAQLITSILIGDMETAARIRVLLASCLAAEFATLLERARYSQP